MTVNHVQRLILFTVILLQAEWLLAAQHSGSVRFGGQPVPGATVTASLGDKKAVTATDEGGRYVFEDLAPGVWLIEIDMFGFTRQSRSVQAGAQPSVLEWVLEMKPRGVRPPAAAAPSRTPLAPSRARASAAQRNTGETDYRMLTLNPEAEGPEMAGPEPLPANAEEYGATESFLVTGSVTRGLEDARREEARDGRRPDMGERFPGGGFGMGMGPQGALGPGAGPGAEPGAGPGAGMGPGAGQRPGMGAGSGPGMRGGLGGGGGPGMGRGGPGGGGGGGGGRGGFAAGGRRGPGGARSRTSIGNRRQRNEIRGSLYFSLRNSALDARPYSLTGQTVAKPSYAQSRFGLTAGGALRIPKLFESEHTIFFFNYTGSRSRNPYNAVATLASPMEREGDFSQSVARGPVTIYDPLSQLPFAGNRIPRDRINPAATGLLSFIPLPNSSGQVQNYQYLASVPNTNDNIGIRVNQTLSRHDRLDFNVNTQRRDSQTAQAFGFRDTGDGNGLSATAGYTHSSSSRITNNLRFSFSRNRNEMTPFFADKTNVAQQLGIGGTSSDPRNWGPPNLSFTNFGGLSDGTPSLRRDQTFSVSEGVTLVRKGHNVTLGGSLRRIEINSLAENGRGAFSFSGIKTSAFDANNQPLAGTGFDFADFLLGLPQSSNIRFGSANTYFRAQAYSAYVNDDWRLRRNFSLNLGVRYEFFTPFTEKQGHIANLDIAPGFTGVAVVTPGQSGPYTGRFPEALIDPDKKLFSPRTGLAWRPLPKRPLIVRAGYSLFFNGSIYNQFPSRLASQPPFATTASVTTSTARVLSLQDGFAASPNQDVTNTYAVDRQYRVPYAQTWNLTAQQSLPHALVVELGYMGTKGTRLDLQRMPNRAAPGSPLTAEQRRQIGNATGFTYDTSIGNSIYHAGDVRITRRFQKGISVNTTYVFSKGIDNASSFGGGGGGGVAQNDSDLRAERGLSSFDQRHSLSVGYYLVSPVGERGLMKSGKWGPRFLGDWSLSGNLAFSSGSPLTARVLGNLSNAGGVIGSGRADATGANIDEGPGFFNLLAFTIPPPGRFGNAGRNTIPGPTRTSMNLGLSRSFRIGDGRRRAEFRVESSNFLNHVSYTSLGTVVNASNYGLPLAAAAMRATTAIMRFRF